MEVRELSFKPILLVEDRVDDIELMRRAMEHNKLANPLVVARDGVEALDDLLARGPCAGGPPPALPALILLDLKLPKVDGLEVLRLMRENKRTSLLPIIILTSSSNEKDRMRSYLLRANSHICKPVDFNNFTEAVHVISLYWLGLNVPPPEPA
jgi:two-component system response regulator